MRGSISKQFTDLHLFLAAKSLDEEIANLNNLFLYLLSLNHKHGNADRIRRIPNVNAKNGPTTPPESSSPSDE